MEDYILNNVYSTNFQDSKNHNDFAMNGSSCPEVLYKIYVRKKFSKFTGKHLC